MPVANAETRPTWRFLGLVVAILAVRLVVAASVHLTEDEAYYRLWSMAPALGYYDHPPMIAWWIAAGRLLAGDTPLGVRLFPAVASALTTLLVFDMARRAGADRRASECAGVWFNCTLLVACGGFLAVPDSAAALFWCLTLWCLLRASATEHQTSWWAAAGAAAGLATLSKYSALFLGPGILLWLLTSADRRRLLLRPGPWIALVAAAAIFGLNVGWNAEHHWLTFAKQFGRVAPHGWSPRFLPELLLGQALLLNPAVLVFLTRWRRARTPITLFIASSLPFAAYLVLHSLHDRVQAHWPAPIYPALAIVAAAVASALGEPFWRRARVAVPAITLVALATLGVLVTLPPGVFVRAPDPFLPVRGWRAFALAVDRTRSSAGAAWVGTTSYGLASELADEKPPSPLLQISERDRWRGPTAGSAPDFAKPGIVVDLTRRLDPGRLSACFAEVRLLGDLRRGAAGERPQIYRVYRVAGPRRDVVRLGCW